MSNQKAIACNYDYIRGADIEEAMAGTGRYSDVVYSRENYPTKGLAFISVEEESLTHIAVYKKSGRVATKLDRVTFYKTVAISPPVPLSDIESSVSNNIKHHFRRQTSNGIATISPKVCESIISFLTDANPALAIQIKILEEEAAGKKAKYRGHAAEIAAHEKDAITISLRIAGFSDQDLPSWDQGDNCPPFLSGYTDVLIREDPMVAHDAQVFGDWNKIIQYIVGAAVFERSGHKLTIMNVNRHKIEENLGVDLLIYHHAFRSYALVQYKRMIKDGDKLAYRPIEKSYKAEIQRMREFQRSNKKSNALKLTDYRLNQEFYYFKLCPAVINDPLSNRMIPGMYVPLEYWELLLQSDSTLGVNDGRIITYENASRYINNTLFVELVQSGWIGSNVENTELITNQIRSSIDAGNSVLIANYEQVNSGT